MTRKGNIQCQAFNYNCFGLLASTPNGHMESVLSHHKAEGSSLWCVHWAPGEGGAVFPQGRAGPVRSGGQRSRAGRVQPGQDGKVTGSFQQTREGL